MSCFYKSFYLFKCSLPALIFWSLFAALIIIPTTLIYAQAETATEIAKTVIEADVPLWEKFWLVLLSIILFGAVVFLWKGLPKFLDLYIKRKDEKLDEKIANAESIEIESNALIKETKVIMERLMEGHEKNKQSIDHINEVVESLKNDNNQDKEERLKRWQEYDTRFKSQVDKLDALEKDNQQIISRLDSQDQYIKSISIGTLENMLETATPVQNEDGTYKKMHLKVVVNGMRAFIRLVGLDRDSYNLTKGHLLIRQYPQQFEMVFNEMKKDNFKNIEIINKDYFCRTMDEISTSYFDRRLFTILKECKDE